MKTKKLKDIKKTVKIERRWANEAKQEGKEEAKASRRYAKKGMPVTAKELKWDSKNAYKWERMREKRADKAAKKIKGKK